MKMLAVRLTFPGCGIKPLRQTSLVVLFRSKYDARSVLLVDSSSNIVYGMVNCFPWDVTQKGLSLLISQRKQNMFLYVFDFIV